MNLHYDHSTPALIELISKADTKLLAHNIALDYDGEVIIDPELHYPQVDLRRYKFHTQIRSASMRNMRKLQALQTALLSAYSETLRTIGGHDLRIAA